MDDVSFWLVVVTVILFFGYAILIERYRKAWMRLPEFTPDTNVTPTAKVTVIIPARNTKHLALRRDVVQRLDRLLGDRRGARLDRLAAGADAQAHQPARDALDDAVA